MRSRSFIAGGWPSARCISAVLGICVVAGYASATPPAAGAETAPHLFQWRPFLAPFHAVVLHLPIGFITAACALEIYRWRRPGEDLRRAAILMLWLSLASGILTAAFGILRAETGGYESKALGLHRIFGLCVPVLTLVTLGAYGFAGRLGGWSGRVLLAATLGMVVAAGHYGGNLTHGSRYLVENAPGFVRELIDKPAAPRSLAVQAPDGDRFFADKVEPILAAKCFTCHGAKKQKGGYRLDQPARILQPGDSGKVPVKPGDPFESHLARLILLPPEHDDIMPPSGKEPLSTEEILVILTWIRNGASLPDTSVVPGG